MSEQYDYDDEPSHPDIPMTVGHAKKNFVDNMSTSTLVLIGLGLVAGGFAIYFVLAFTSAKKAALTPPAPTNETTTSNV